MVNQRHLIRAIFTRAFSRQVALRRSCFPLGSWALVWPRAGSLRSAYVRIQFNSLQYSKSTRDMRQKWTLHRQAVEILVRSTLFRGSPRVDQSGHIIRSSHRRNVSVSPFCIRPDYFGRYRPILYYTTQVSAKVGMRRFAIEVYPYYSSEARFLMGTLQKKKVVCVRVCVCVCVPFLTWF